jgi:hypothetical protein
MINIFRSNDTIPSWFIESYAMIFMMNSPTYKQAVMDKLESNLNMRDEEYTSAVDQFNEDNI